MQLIRQSSFNMGEVDANNFKRSESADYLNAAQSMLNMQVTTTGMARKRQGTKFLLDVTGYSQPESKMFEYIDKNNNYYIVLAYNFVFTVFSANMETGLITFLSALTTPYPKEIIKELDYALSNDSLVFTHPNYQPARLFISDYNLLAFTFQYLLFSPYPAYDFQYINYNNSTVTITSLPNSKATITFTGGGGGNFNDQWVGGQIVGMGNSVESPLGYGIIESLSHPAANSTAFVVVVVQPFEMTAGDYPTKGSFWSVKMPAWSDSLGWPAKVLFFQNRLWFANSKSLPSTIFGSKINSFVNFDVGTGRDIEAIIYTLGQTSSGGIVWLNGGKQLEIYTINYEFVCPQDQNIALTPATFSIRQQAAYGVSNNMKPCTYLNDSYYVARTGKGIINFKFEGVGLAYRATNISAQCEHLVKNPINRAVIKGESNSQDNFIYFLNNDLSITSFQFAYEYKLAALTPWQFQMLDSSVLETEDGVIIETETNNPIEIESSPSVQIIDIVSINNRLVLLKYYALSAKYAFEMQDRVKLDSYHDTTMDNSGQITGLEILNGYTVDVIFNNNDLGSYYVDEGQIVVDNPESFEGPVQVGLLFDVILIPMYVYAGPNKSVYFKTIKRIYVDYYNSLNFYVNDTLVPYQYYSNIQTQTGLVPISDTAIVDACLGYERFQTFTITQRSPFDLHISAITYEIDDALI